MRRSIPHGFHRHNSHNMSFSASKFSRLQSSQVIESEVRQWSLISVPPLPCRNCAGLFTPSLVLVLSQWISPIKKNKLLAKKTARIITRTFWPPMFRLIRRTTYSKYDHSLPRQRQKCKTWNKSCSTSEYYKTLKTCVNVQKPLNYCVQLARIYTGLVDLQGPDLQNILRQSYDYLTIMPKLRSTYHGRLIYKTSYEGRKVFLMVRFTCKVVRSSETVFAN